MSAQFFEGSGNGVSSLGFKTGDFKYISLGTSYNFNAYLSAGVSFMVTFEKDLEKPVFIELKADFHLNPIFNLKKSDILLGYNYESGFQGVHMVYQRSFSDMFGVFGRANYYFKKDTSDFFNDKIDESKLNFEVGIIFRILSPEPIGGF